MLLSPQQTVRFYRIWFPLLHYVNEQRQLGSTFPATYGEATPPLADVLPLRNALWADDELLETFISLNPAGLSSADLQLVASWRYRVAGTFYIVRYLKKYTVFLTERSPTRAYGVLGLASPLEEITGGQSPLRVQAVLLPFEDHIIYDSLLEPYAIFFGPGIRGSLNEQYRNVQEREGIITTLEPMGAYPSAEESRKGMLAREAKLLAAFRKDLARRGLSPSKVEQHVGTIQTFAQTYLLIQDPPRGLLETTLADVQTYLSTTGARSNTTSFRRFVRFLSETGRMDYEQSEPLREFLQHVSD